MEAFRISGIVRGDVWSDRFCGPLVRMGVCVQEGDVLEAINHRPISRKCPPSAVLANGADKEVWMIYRERKRCVNCRNIQELTEFTWIGVDHGSLTAYACFGHCTASYYKC